MSHYFSDCSSDQETFKKANWQLGSNRPSSYSTLKASLASQILTTTGDKICRTLQKLLILPLNAHDCEEYQLSVAHPLDRYWETHIDVRHQESDFFML
jgi:hypothetical protein